MNQEFYHHQIHQQQKDHATTIINLKSQRSSCTSSKDITTPTPTILVVVKRRKRNMILLPSLSNHTTNINNTNIMNHNHRTKNENHHNNNNNDHNTNSCIRHHQHEQQEQHEQHQEILVIRKRQQGTMRNMNLLCDDSSNINNNRNVTNLDDSDTSSNVKCSIQMNIIKSLKEHRLRCTRKRNSPRFTRCTSMKRIYPRSLSSSSWVMKEVMVMIMIGTFVLSFHNMNTSIHGLQLRQEDSINLQRKQQQQQYRQNTRNNKMNPSQYIHNNNIVWKVHDDDFNKNENEMYDILPFSSLLRLRGGGDEGEDEDEDGNSYRNSDHEEDHDDDNEEQEMEEEEEEDVEVEEEEKTRKEEKDLQKNVQNVSMNNEVDTTKKTAITTNTLNHHHDDDDETKVAINDNKDNDPNETPSSKSFKTMMTKKKNTTTTKKKKKNALDTTSFSKIEDNTTIQTVVPITEIISTETTSSSSFDTIRQEAATLRASGKEYHDMGQYENAAIQFASAKQLLATLLLEQVQQQPSIINHHEKQKNDDDEEENEEDSEYSAYDNENETEQDESESVRVASSLSSSTAVKPVATTTITNLDDIVEEYVTCCLHEALCYLKCEQYENTILACNVILERQQQENSNNKKLHTQSDSVLFSLSNANIAPALLARAYHRRSKAIVALWEKQQQQQQQQIEQQKVKKRKRKVEEDGDYDEEDEDEEKEEDDNNNNNLKRDDVGGVIVSIESALQDAKSAAFLGDRKAVAFYGKLMRTNKFGTSSSSPTFPTGSSNNPFASLSDLFSPNGMDSSLSTSTPSLFPSSNSLLSSLLQKSPNNQGPADNNMFSPLSMMSSFLPGMNNSGNGSGTSPNLIRSVVSSLYKRIEDETTQNSVCNFIQSTSGSQISQMASLAGIQIQKENANKMVSICQKYVTPTSIKSTIRTTKRIVYVVRFVRKCMQVIHKYRTVLVLLMILSWIHNSIYQPIPVNKRLLKRIVAAT